MSALSSLNNANVNATEQPPAKRKRPSIVEKKDESTPKVGEDLPYHSVTDVSTRKKVGDTLPNILFKTRERIPEMMAKGEENPFDWVDKTTADLFGGKRIGIFCLPGAFTPTCSSKQLPGYNKHYDELLSLGLDDVYCLSVNDAFVMRQWALHQGFKEKEGGKGEMSTVKFIPDGHAGFTRGMGMSCSWGTERGFGERSWRYAMVVNDSVIEWMAIEEPVKENSGPDPFQVSRAEDMVAYLKGNKEQQAKA